MSAINFAKGCDIAAWDCFENIAYKSKACAKAAEIYTEHLIRAHAISLLPGYCFMNGEYWGHSVCFALLKLRSSDNTDTGVLHYASQVFMEARSTRPKEQSIFDYREGVQNVENVTRNERHIIQGMEALFESMIILAWSAYEILAADLMRNVLLECPPLDTKNSWTNTERDCSGLGSRSKLANYYRFTFRQDNADILAVVDNPAVHALGIARNVLVHAAGKIDKMFQNDRVGFTTGNPKTSARTPIPQLKRIRGRKIGYKIHFPGDFTRDLIDPVTPLGFGLVKAVDEWLVRHP